MKLSEVIDRYVRDSERELGKTKAQVLEKIKEYEIADLNCSEIKSQQIVKFVESLKVQPQTRSNYLSHLSAVFRVARPLWAYPLDPQQIDDAIVGLRRLGKIGKGNTRERRPTLDELDRLMEHFEQARAHRPGSAPMAKITAFAIFSTRRQEEITRIIWEDFEVDRIWVRDMKYPENKKGNEFSANFPPRQSQSSNLCLAWRQRSFRSRPTPSARHSHGHANSSKLKICIFMICAMTEFQGCSKWEGQSPKSQPFLGIAVGPA